MWNRVKKMFKRKPYNPDKMISKNNYDGTYTVNGRVMDARSHSDAIAKYKERDMYWNYKI